MLLSKLLDGLEYQVVQGSLDIEIKNIRNNSHDVMPGDLFFCISGAAFDGHKYAGAAAESGASAILVEKEIEVPSDVVVIKTKDTRYAMGMVSAKYFGEPSKKLTVIGITGTKGKTTTAYMIREMLLAAGYKTGLIGTIELIDGKNSIPAMNTTPESLLLQKTLRDMVDNGLDSVVMEVSSQGLKLNRVAGIDFDFGIFTNLSSDHIGPNEHENFEDYKQCKMKLFSLCKMGIFNVDDPYTKEFMESACCRKITYGIHEVADYRARHTSLYFEDGILGIKYFLEGRKKGEVIVDVPGEFSVYNSLAALAVADALKVDVKEVADILKSIRVRGRVEMIPISDRFTILIDYAHNALAMESLYSSLLKYHPKRLISVFGCGGNRSKKRRYQMGEISGKLADFTILTNDNPRYENPIQIINDIVIGMEKVAGKYLRIYDRKEAIRYAIMHAEEGDIIVLAGKGHEDYQEIDGHKYPMDERKMIGEILEEEDVTKICGYNNRYFPRGDRPNLSVPDSIGA